MTSQKWFDLSAIYSTRDPSAKVIVRKFSLLLYKSRCRHMHRTSACCLRQLIGRRKVFLKRFSNGWSVHIWHIRDNYCLSNPRPARIVLVFFLAKCHRVLGTRQSDIRDINRRSLPPSQADLSTFRFDVLYLLNTFLLKFTRTEYRTTDVFKKTFLRPINCP